MNSKKYLFRSKRLGFRNWLDEDLAPFSEMCADQEVMKYFPNTLTPAETQGLIDRLTNEFKKNDFTFYAVDKLVNGEFIGFIGLIKTTIETSFTPCVEIGWRIKKSAWGQGFATEGALRCIDYGFTELKLPEIYSYTPKVNVKSEKVMTKIGMHQIGTFNHPKIEDNYELIVHVVYKIVADLR